MPARIPTATVPTKNSPKPRRRFWARFWEHLRHSLGGVCG
jgi:hypothetical protein